MENVQKNARLDYCVLIQVGKAKKQCIGCMACVNACMQKAKVAKVNPIVKLVMKIILRQASRERKEPLILVA